MCSPRISLDSEQSLFEALPRDILVIRNFYTFYLSEFQAWILIVYKFFVFKCVFYFSSLQVQISCGVNHKDLKQVFMSQKRLEKWYV